MMLQEPRLRQEEDVSSGAELLDEIEDIPGFILLIEATHIPAHKMYFTYWMCALLLAISVLLLSRSLTFFGNSVALEVKRGLRVGGHTLQRAELVAKAS